MVNNNLMPSPPCSSLPPTAALARPSPYFLFIILCMLCPFYCFHFLGAKFSMWKDYLGFILLILITAVVDCSEIGLNSSIYQFQRIDKQGWRGKFLLVDDEVQ